jgi:hypothetical protein
LIHFNDKVKVSYQGKRKEGGYGAIQKCFIENDSAIPKHWAFVAKTQKDNTPAAHRVLFNTEAMALRPRGLHQMDHSSSNQIGRIHFVVEWRDHSGDDER